MYPVETVLFTMSNLMYLFALTMLFTKISSQSLNSPYKIVDGNLFVTEKFHFSIYAEELRGVIVYGLDYLGNQFLLQVRQGAEGHNNMWITFNKVSIEVSLNQLCSCDPCNGTAVTFTVKFQDGFLSVGCNNGMVAKLPLELRKSNRHDEYGDEILYLIPAAIANQSNKIFIIMGNIGQYDGSYGRKVFPIKQQVIGCLLEFFHNDSRLTFVKGNSNFKSSCKFKCRNNTCNGGMCRERPTKHPICDCSPAPLNGPHCNKELMIYNRSEMNTFGVRRGTKAIYLKATWRPLPSKVYCLLNLVLRDGHVTISTNGTHVLINGSTFDVADKNRVIFVSVNITDNYSVVKSKNNISLVGCSTVGVMRINVGFSESGDRCEIFDGSYDLQFDPQELLRRHQEVDTKPIIANGTPSPGNGISSNKIWFIICALVGVMVLMHFVLLLYRILRKKFRNRVKEPDCNVYDIENVDQQNVESRFTYIDGGHYSSIVQESQYVNVNYNDNTDLDECVLTRDSVEEVPPLPPRG